MICVFGGVRGAVFFGDDRSSSLSSALMLIGQPKHAVALQLRVGAIASKIRIITFVRRVGNHINANKQKPQPRDANTRRVLCIAMCLPRSPR